MSFMHKEQLHEAIRGLLVGVVTDNKDPEGIYRVQVKYAVPSGDILSNWARMVTRMAGPMMGWACLPEPDDEVLLRFVNGHPHQPMIVGAVHNGKDKPPFDNADGENNLRIFHSRNLHKLELDDKSGAERISVWSTDEKTTLDMLTADELIIWQSTKNIEIYCPSGKLLVEAGKDVTMKANSKWVTQTASGVNNNCDANIDIKGSAGVAITGPKVEMKA